MIRCWACGKVTGVIGRPARSALCPHCKADLRTCRGCQFWAPDTGTQCRETRAEPPVEKEKSNFCEYFKAAENPVGGAVNQAAVAAAAAAPSGPAQTPQEKAKADLEALFSFGKKK